MGIFCDEWDEDEELYILVVGFVLVFVFVFVFVFVYIFAIKCYVTFEPYVFDLLGSIGNCKMDFSTLASLRIQIETGIAGWGVNANLDTFGSKSSQEINQILGPSCHLYSDPLN